RLPREAVRLRRARCADPRARAAQPAGSSAGSARGRHPVRHRPPACHPRGSPAGAQRKGARRARGPTRSRRRPGLVHRAAPPCLGSVHEPAQQRRQGHHASTAPEARRSARHRNPGADRLPNLHVMRRLAERLPIRWLKRRLPSRTIRLRLTLVYGGLFIASGAALLAITYVLVRHSTEEVLVGTKGKTTFVVSGTGNSQTLPPGAAQVQSRNGGAVKKLKRRQAIAHFRRDTALARSQHNIEMNQLLEQSGVALAIMAALSIMLGWIVAGRVLRPLRTITDAAREISASNLHRRLSLEGPDDELTRLGDTFDGLLERLEASFAAQRQFVANASHELRTPLTFERTLLEVALADPNASAETLRRTCEQLLANSEHQEQLIEALLILSRSQRGLDQRERFDLAVVS